VQTGWARSFYPHRRPKVCADGWTPVGSLFPQYFAAPPHIEVEQPAPASIAFSLFALILRLKGLWRILLSTFADRHDSCYYCCMILVIIHMKVSAKRRKELSQTITSLLNSIRAEKGCGRCDFFHGLNDENILCLLEEWDTGKSFAAHRESECFKVLRGAMNLLGEMCEITSYKNEPASEGIGQSCMCMLKKS
jgi:quinol monooxygenase YgiN